MFPTPEILAPLTPFERLSLRLGRFANGTPAVKTALQHFNDAFNSRFLQIVSAGRVHVVGIEKMIALRPDRGVIIAANHRSFFDMHMITKALHDHVDWYQRTFFPIRSAFFYERPAGVLVNAILCGMAAFPPVFRTPEKREATRFGMDFLTDQLRHPGTLVGIHPEGKRGTGSDPYEILPGEPGFGRLVLEARPIVIPVFLNGLGNHFGEEFRSTLAGTGTPIVIVFGDPMDLSAFSGGDPHRLRSQIDVSRVVLDGIRQLAEVERGERARL